MLMITNQLVGLVFLWAMNVSEIREGGDLNN